VFRASVRSSTSRSYSHRDRIKLACLAERRSHREVGAFEAKNKLAELLDEVEHGGEVVITRRGKPVARLVAPAAFDPAAGRAAAERIKQRSRKVMLGGLSIKSLIEEGQR
jgi:prevent-host-death family protein